MLSPFIAVSLSTSAFTCFTTQSLVSFTEWTADDLMYERSVKLIFLSILWTHFSIHHMPTCAYLKRVDLQYHSFSLFLSFFAFLRCTQTFYLHGAANQTTAGLKGGGAKNSLLQTWVLENKATYFWFGFFSSEPTDAESEIFNPQSEYSFGDHPDILINDAPQSSVSSRLLQAMTHHANLF